MNPLRVSCQISANQREAEARTSAKVNKHWKTSAKSNDVIPLSSPPISISHRFFRQRCSNSRDVVASSPSVLAPLPERPEELARRLINLPHLTAQEPYFKSFQSGEKKILNSILYTNTKRFKIGYLSSMTNVLFAKIKKGTLFLFLFYCLYSNLFWKNVEQ